MQAIRLETAALGFAAALAMTGPAAAEPRPVITASRTTGMAPFAVHVHGTASDPGRGTLLTARLAWDFGDPGSRGNGMVGFNAAHVYDEPGEYTITLALSDEAGTAVTTTVEVTVAPPGRRAVYVSPDGDDRRGGATPDAAVRTLGRVHELLGHEVEVLFERGGAYPATPGVKVGGRNVLFSAWGEGPPPLILWSGAEPTTTAIIEQSARSHDVVIQDLEFVCPAPPRRKNVRAINTNGRRLTVRRCRFDGVSYAIRAAGHPAGILSFDNVAGVLGAYYAWGQGTDHVHFGNTVAGSADEHNMRFLAERVLVEGNDLTNTGKRTIWCMSGGHVTIRNNRLREGPLVTGPRTKDDGRCRMIVIEANRLERAPIVVRHGSEHVLVGSNVIRADGAIAIDVWGHDAAMDRTSRDVRVIHNTAVNLAAHGRFLAIGPRTEGVVVANNLYAAPSLKTGPRDTANVFVLDRDLGSARIHHNVWSEPAVTGWGGGWQYLWPYRANAEGFRDAAAWDALPQTSHERYRRFGAADLDEEFRPRFDADLGVPVAGGRYDLDGNVRPIDGAVTVGAVQGGDGGK